LFERRGAKASALLLFKKSLDCLRDFEPAQATSLHDRGAVELGLRADVLRVRVVCAAWRQGQRVL
jgi:alpha-D-ribose 1-methylphosphonate 5-triphosphate diphosphatase PhnM